MLRFALHRQGQDSQVCTRCHTIPCPVHCLYCPTASGLVIAQQSDCYPLPPTGGRVFLPALHDRVLTVGVR
jgi:hypothetical protein